MCALPHRKSTVAGRSRRFIFSIGYDLYCISSHRPSCYPYVRPGDTVVITELSRMTRSLVHLLEVVRDFEQREIELISLREHIDTSTATGRCFLAITGAMAQMERELKAERTAAGRAAAKARGRTGGRPRTDPDKLEQARILYLHANKTAADVCRTVGIGRRTLFSYLAQVRGQKEGTASKVVS
jgi:DNA invertase Pin-like site-specific DNA recombinase